MVEMLKCSSLGTVRGGTVVEAPLQTPRELKSASTGAGGTAVLDRGHSLCQEGTGHSLCQEGTGEPRENRCLPPSVASLCCPHLQPGSSSFQGQQRQVLTGAARAAGSCRSQQNFPLLPFCGCPGLRSWPGKLLTIPILNTSVMVYGP